VDAVEENVEMVETIESPLEGMALLKVEHNLKEDKSENLVSAPNEGGTRKRPRNPVNLEVQGLGEDRKYFCSNCDFSAQKKYMIVTHKQEEHGGITYSCDICSETFSTKKYHDVHIKSIHEGVVWQCKECGKIMQDEHNLKIHKKNNGACTLCAFSSCWRSLRKHMQTVHNNLYHNGVFNCDQCDFVSQTWKNVQRHIKSYHKAEHLICDQCPYKTTRIFQLKKHTDKIHMGIKEETSKCHICFKTVVAKSLKMHIRLYHDDENKIPCSQCDHMSKTNTHLNDHIRLVHDKIRLKCKQCDLSFNFKGSLRRHIKKVHEGITFPCDQCEYVGNFSESLSTHKSEAHIGVSYNCSKCEYKSFDKNKLRVHFRETHEDFVCDTCQKSCVTKEELSNHKNNSCIKKRTTNIYTCDKCNFRFSNKKVLIKHKKQCMETKSDCQSSICCKDLSK